MAEQQRNNLALKPLLDRVEERLSAAAFPEICSQQLDAIATQIAMFVRSLVKHHAECMNNQLSRELTVEELAPKHFNRVCTMASHFESREISDGAEALSVLRKHGFEVREFISTTFVPHDSRLQEAPDEWLFRQTQEGALPQRTIESKNIVMICEIRPKPDVVSDQSWIQHPYVNDPFREELAALHTQLDSYKLEKRIDPCSRAGFTFNELEEHVLPALSKRAGITLECMPALYACILANDHPAMSNGRSTEWRGETMGKAHALISGRSDRGPIRYIYYDTKNDPYPNRGFRVCAVLGTTSQDSEHPSS